MFFICILVGRFIEDDKIKIITQVVLGALTYAVILSITKDELIISLKNKFFKEKV